MLSISAKLILMAQKSATTKLNKQEAIRRLIHAAIRMIAAEEDPFAVHLLIQSADKTLIDVAKKLGKELRVDWELFIKDEYHKQFFAMHRELFNYFKHGDKDPDDEIEIKDIQTRNLLDLYALTSNYGATYDTKTRHMHLFQIFVLQIFPDLVVMPGAFKEKLDRSNVDSAYLTPREFFKQVDENHIMPGLVTERLADFAPLGDFYSLTFKEIRSGVTQNPRKLTIPDY
jgi:hypothetical protein